LITRRVVAFLRSRGTLYADLSEDFDQREPVEPPAALMRKRKHVALWIVLALALGGLIALMMVGLSQ
jgi:hypothetical protein